MLVKTKDKVWFNHHNNTNDFFSDKKNEETIRFFICNKIFDQSLEDDIYQFIALSFIKYRTVERFDKNVSSFYTFIANSISKSIQTYCNHNKKYKKFEPSEYLTTGVSKRDTNKTTFRSEYSITDKAIESYELKKDFMAFVRWYRVYITDFKYKNEKVDELKIIKLKWLGLNATEIAKKMNIPMCYVYFCINKMLKIYKIFIKS